METAEEAIRLIQDRKEPRDDVRPGRASPEQEAVGTSFKQAHPLYYRSMALPR